MNSVLNLSFRKTKEAKHKLDELTNNVDAIHLKVADKNNLVDKLNSKVEQLENDFKDLLGVQVRKDEFQKVIDEIIENVQEVILNQTPRETDFLSRIVELENEQDELKETVKVLVDRIMVLEDQSNHQNINTIKVADENMRQVSIPRVRIDKTLKMKK